MSPPSPPDEPAAFHVIEPHSIVHLKADIACAARSAANVLITGVPGSGKGLIARLLHDRSERAGGPFIIVDAPGVPEGALESRLAGAFAQGAGGTVLLRGIAGIGARLQTVLFDLLAPHRRTDRNRSEPSGDVRLMTTTARDLHADVLAGVFREDLYYRLNMVRVDIESAADVNQLQHVEQIQETTLGDLRELVAALDRRVPDPRRIGEPAVVRAALALKLRALEHIAQLNRSRA